MLEALCSMGGDAKQALSLFLTGVNVSWLGSRSGFIFYFFALDSALTTREDSTTLHKTAFVPFCIMHSKGFCNTATII